MTALNSFGNDAEPVVLEKAMSTDTSKKALLNTSFEFDYCHSRRRLVQKSMACS